MKPKIIFPSEGSAVKIKLKRNNTHRKTSIEPIFASKFVEKNSAIFFIIIDSFSIFFCFGIKFVFKLVFFSVFSVFST